MELLERLYGRERKLSVYGLGLFMLLAGASKFLILDYWTGYEPQILVSLVPLEAEQLTLLGGVFEALTGLLLMTRRKTAYVAGAVSLWLSLITLQVARLGLWDLTIRDLGLTFYAYSVTLRALRDTD